MHVTYTPDTTEQTQWTTPARFTIDYDVVHQLDAGEIQVVLQQ